MAELKISGKMVIGGTVDTLLVMKVKKLVKDKKYKSISNVLETAIRKFIDEEERKITVNF